MRKYLALLLLPVLVGAAWSAPQDEVLLRFDQTDSLPQEYAGSGEVLKAIGGEFTGDGIPDLVVMREVGAQSGPGGPPGWGLIYASNHYAIPLGIELNFEDAVLFPASEAGQLDRLAVVNGNLLELVEVTSNGWEVSDSWSGGWGHVDRLELGVAPDSFVNLIVMVEAEGTRLWPQWMMKTGSPFYPMNPIDGLQGVGDLVLVDMDGDGAALELAFLDGGQLHIRSYDGTALRAPIDVSGDALLASLERTDGGDPGVALVVDTGQQLELYVVGLTGIDGPVSLGPRSLDRLTAGDTDGDGSPELFLSSSSPEEVLVLRGPSPGNSYSLVPSEAQILNSGSQPNTGGPGATTLFDFDLDGDLDAAVVKTSWWSTYEGVGITADLRIPSASGFFLEVDLGPPITSEVVVLEGAWSVGSPEEFPSQDYFVEVALLRQANYPFGTAEFIDFGTLGSTLHPRASTGMLESYSLELSQLDPPLDPEQDFTVHYLEVRLRGIDGDLVAPLHTLAIARNPAIRGAIMSEFLGDFEGIISLPGKQIQGVGSVPSSRIPPTLPPPPF